MLTFKPVAQRDLSRLRRYYKNCNYQLCEYSALVKLMWRGHLHPQYAEAAGCRCETAAFGDGHQRLDLAHREIGRHVRHLPPRVLEYL